MNYYYYGQLIVAQIRCGAESQELTPSIRRHSPGAQPGQQLTMNYTLITWSNKKKLDSSFDRNEPFSVALWLQTPDLKDRGVVFHRSRAWTDAAIASRSNTAARPVAAS